MSQQGLNAAEIHNWLVEHIAKLLEIDPKAVSITEPLADYGMSSREAALLAGDLEDWLQRELSPTLIWEYPSIELLAEHLSQEGEKGKTPADLVSVHGLRMTSPDEPIAVVGIGCRFPSANGPEMFWEMLRQGIDAITQIPAERWDISQFYHPTAGIPGKMNTMWGGFLKDVDQFDAGFFGISPREGVRMDPQQRLLLEVAWEALEHACIVPGTLANSKTGVFIGISSNDYGRFELCNPNIVGAYDGVGNALSIAANRLSYVFNLRGPSIAVDTACSSSLVSIHLACQSLRHRESDLAIAGGVNLILSPQLTISFANAGMMAPQGRCRTFDASAEGYVRSEGCGLVVLKRLSEALADDDQVLAVIRGSAVNQDGRSNGLTAPNRAAQEAVISQALANANVTPAQISYVEAHGTGTILGDPIEVSALKNVLMQDRRPDQPCAFGSVKANVGHMEAAAGIAGLIKTILALHHGEIPPHLHLKQLNEYISLEDTPFDIPVELRQWSVSEADRFAGVSSFGFGGTNAHVILQQAPSAVITQQADQEEVKPEFHVLPLSAKSSVSLQELVQGYRTWLLETDATLTDICYTAGSRRTHHKHRLAVVGGSKDQISERLTGFLKSEKSIGVFSGPSLTADNSKLAFVFSGQGAQWLGMGRKLLVQEPAFRTALEACEQAMQPYTDWSVLGELKASEDTSQLERTDVRQPLLFAVQVGLAALWRSWGIEPTAVVGHSMGEIAAAHVAGALSLNDACRIVCGRSRLMRRLSGQGTMALVELPLGQAEELLADDLDQLSIGAVNDPHATVLSGSPTALGKVLDKLKAQNVFCRWVKIDVAPHSPQMDIILDELGVLLDGIKPKKASIPIYSTVDAEVKDGPELNASYWVRALREPVLFSSAISQLVADGYDIFLEVSAHPVLLPSIQKNLYHSSRNGVVLPTLRRLNEAAFYESLAVLYTLGQSIDWGQVSRFGKIVSLPKYPWEHKRLWLTDEVAESAYAHRPNARSHLSALLGPSRRSPAPAERLFWEIDLSTATFPYLADHQVQSSVVLPASVYVEMALAAAVEISETETPTLKQLTFEQLLHLPHSSTRTVQLVLGPDKGGRVGFELFSHLAAESEWTRHATGTITTGSDEETAPIPIEDIRKRCNENIPAETYYLGMAEHGLEYGPAFQGITRLWRQDGEALARLQLADTLIGTTYQVHPALLDACFQVLGATLPQALQTGSLYLPISIDRLLLLHRPAADGVFWGYARLTSTIAENTEPLTGDVFLTDEQGKVLLAAYGFRVQRWLQSKKTQTASEWLYQISWESHPRESETPSAVRPGDWLIFADEGGVSDALVAALQAQNERCIIVSRGGKYTATAGGQYTANPAALTDLKQLLQAAFNATTPCKGIIYLWGLDAAPAEILNNTALQTAEQIGCVGVLHLVKALAHIRWHDEPRLWLITQGTQVVNSMDAAPGIAQSPLWGMGRVIGHEYPGLNCTLVDLSPKHSVDELQSLVTELLTDASEDQIALRDTARYTARLTRYREDSTQEALIPANGRPFRLVTSQVGVLDNLHLQITKRRTPQPDEVEIRVCAAGLNFLDVLSAMGLRPDETNAGPLLFGHECAGVVVAVGENVADFTIGDNVIAVASGSFGSHVTTPAAYVARMPSCLSFAEAATIPITFMTAHYALRHLSRLQPGERILIHSATGGTGLAAVKIAQMVGAEIFATAGSEKKRNYLRSLGIQHVMDSRSLTFADEVMTHTQGLGVDVVLNSLSGEAISKGLEILAPYGRFLEISKRDIHENHQLGLSPFQKNLSYFAIDLARMSNERPDLFSSLLQEVIQYFADGILEPLPVCIFPMSQAVEAFRYMAQAKHIGKIILSLEDNSDLHLAAALPEEILFRSDATYLLTGGLGGLGLTIAHWMIGQGARCLVLVGRRKPDAVIQAKLAKMRAAGAQVVVVQGDVTKPDQVKRILDELEQTLPPLRGIIHGAAVLDDGILLHLNADRLRTVMAPKVDGAWNLHALTTDKPLDFFVLFSSVASLLGSPGQGNYSAANAFLDALAYHRRMQGQVGLSINWGPWSEIGLAAQAKPDESPIVGGIRAIMPEQGVEIFGHLLGQNTIQVSVMALNLHQWRQFYPKASQSTLFTHLIDEKQEAVQSTQSNRLRNMFRVAEPDQRRHLIGNYLHDQITHVLRLDPAQLDENTPLGSLGFDSLMTLELRNQLEADLDLNLPVTLIWNYQTIAELTSHLVEKMGYPLDQTELSVTEDAPEAEAEPLEHILSDEERELLTTLLSELDGTSLDDLQQALADKEK